MREFIVSMRVYYEDTDSAGVVYHANYLKFMERARTEWLRSLGIEQDELARDEGVIFAVRSIALDYFKPARFNDLLQISVMITRIGGASISLSQSITKTHAEANTISETQQSAGTQRESSAEAAAQVTRQQTTAKNVLCSGKVKVACLAAGSLRPKPIPGKINREIFL